AAFRHGCSGLRRLAGVEPRGPRQAVLGRDAHRAGLNLSIVGITLLCDVAPPIAGLTSLLRLPRPLASGAAGAISRPQQALGALYRRISQLAAQSWRAGSPRDRAHLRY